MFETLKRLSRRDRITLEIGVGAAALFLILNFGLFPLFERLGVSAEALQEKEVELRRDRRLIAQAEVEQTSLAAARERLKTLEAGLLESATPSLANAEWQRLVGNLAESRGIQLVSSELLRSQDLGSGYSLLTGRVQFRCRLDQLVEYLVAIAGFPKLLSISGLTVFASQGDPQGRITVQLTIGAATRSMKAVKAEEH